MELISISAGVGTIHTNVDISTYDINPKIAWGMLTRRALVDSAAKFKSAPSVQSFQNVFFRSSTHTRHIILLFNINRYPRVDFDVAADQAGAPSEEVQRSPPGHVGTGQAYLAIRYQNGLRIWN
jgi:hypothetical protein